MFRRLAAFRAARAARAAVDTVVPVARRAVEPDDGWAVPPPPDYFGGSPNFANSPLPRHGPDGRAVAGTGIRKFVAALPLPGTAPNELGALIPVAVPDTISYPGCDYYEIGIVEYAQRLHPDLPPTTLRGYRQLNLGTDGTGRNTVGPPGRAYHPGPMIVARRDRPVRITYVNLLPTGPAGDLFLPVDTTITGTGPEPQPMGPGQHPAQNRTVVHLDGAAVPWISAGNPAQWFTPAGEATVQARGPGYATVPDMPDPGDGAATAYYPNRQSGRLMWFHDQSPGTTRLTVYSGQIGLYRLDDPAERRLVAEGVLPAEEIPLVIGDRTFVPDADQLAAQDPTWDTRRWGGSGSLWFPHVYLPEQNPGNKSGRNPMGRWPYGPWVWPPPAGPWVWPPPAGPDWRPVPEAGHDPAGQSGQPPARPATPIPSIVPAAFHDTPVLNGCAYPYLRVRPAAYRFRILNACTDRSLNLQWYRAASNGPMWHPDGSLRDGDAGEVPLVAAVPGPDRPATWPTDGRPGGVPDPAAAGPDWIQIGTEGGLLPAPAVLPSQPIDYEYDRRSATRLNVTGHSLLLGPGEQADVVVDFGRVSPGTNLILYNDAPAPMPSLDPRYDYHTGAADRTGQGGAPPTLPGWGPNTRTLMQVRVTGKAAASRDAAPVQRVRSGGPAARFDGPAARFDLGRLADRLPGAYAASQPPPVVPAGAYDRAFGTSTARDVRAPAATNTLTFTPSGGTVPISLDLRLKTINPGFDRYGRSTSRLTGTEPQRPGTEPRRAGTEPRRAGTEPPADVLFPTDGGGPDRDGTQLWRIRNLDAQTHPVRVPYLDVQLVNRVGRDGTVRPPEANEFGWKTTIRVNPMEDAIVAMRPVRPAPLPFKVSNSVRPDQSAGPGPHDFGWEYVWHSRLLSQADNGAARPLVLRIAPLAPTGLTAAPDPGSSLVPPSIVLAWTDNANDRSATGFVVQRATDSGFTHDVVTVTLAPSVTRYTDTDVTPSTGFRYRVRAENAVAHSAWSNPAGTAVQLRPPTGLTAAVPDLAPLRVALTWANHSCASTVEIQRAVNPTFTGGLVTVTVPASTACADVGVAPDTVYYHRVRTTYRGASSSWSTVAVVRTPAVPATPDDLTATATAGSDTSPTDRAGSSTGTSGPPGADWPDVTANRPGAKVEVRWAGHTTGTVTSFIVQRATDRGFGTVLTVRRVPGTARSVTDTGLAGNTTYHYRVQAVNQAGSSAFTDPVSVRTLP